MRLATSAAAWTSRLPWPLPAFLAWAAGWALWQAAGLAGVPAASALAAGIVASWVVAWPCRAGLRRLLAAAGFPLLALGLTVSWPPWLWLLLLAPLLAAYPPRAWRDAPFFPTPLDALAGLAEQTGTPRRVLDAGCGLGHGLAALRRVWPQAELHGVEWSPLLAWLAALRCPAARVERGDMWGASWAGYDLVYLFQRPESMARAWAKAERELGAQAWLVSLEFAVPGRTPCASLQGPGRRPVWIYRPAAGKESSIEGRPGR
jgi:SAM-dependent methyltransferase